MKVKKKLHTSYKRTTHYESENVILEKENDLTKIKHHTEHISYGKRSHLLFTKFNIISKK